MEEEASEKVSPFGDILPLTMMAAFLSKASPVKKLEGRGGSSNGGGSHNNEKKLLACTYRYRHAWKPRKRQGDSTGGEDSEKVRRRGNSDEGVSYCNARRLFEWRQCLSPLGRILQRPEQRTKTPQTRASGTLPSPRRAASSEGRSPRICLATLDKREDLNDTVLFRVSAADEESKSAIDRECLY